MEQLKPGHTLYLRGGAYYEHVRIKVSGTLHKPVTIRGYPGELAIVDGGLCEFFEKPESAWEPFPEGAEGEFRSTEVYPDLGGRAGYPNVMGNFGDSMVPLHGYRHFPDLRDPSLYWDLASKMDADESVYCGPGILYDVETDRIHVRLAHTDLKGLGDDNYRGETDPRKIPLVIAGSKSGPALAIQGAQFVRLQDLVVRGARGSALHVGGCTNVILDGLTVYGGSCPIGVGDTAGLRVLHTACRGVAAPWTFRGSLKYRSTEARLFSAGGRNPDSNRDFEIAYSEFTDCVDGVFVGNVKGLWFHHNLVDNLSDDGIYLTSATALDGSTHGGDIYIYQNLLSRCLTTFAFGVGHGRQKWLPIGRQTGSGVHIYRNVFDFRRGVMYYCPPSPHAPQEINSAGRFACDHGGPAWEPMNIYHNTIIARDRAAPFGAQGVGDHLSAGVSRRIFNNIFVQTESRVGQYLPSLVKAAAPPPEEPEEDEVDPFEELFDAETGERPAPGKGGPAEDVPEDLVGQEALEDIQVAAKAAAVENAIHAAKAFRADGNLHWSCRDGDSMRDFLGKFRCSESFMESMKDYPPGWTANDEYAEPRFKRFSPDWRDTWDLSLTDASPAVKGGVELPADWPDPVRVPGAKRPDRGALPLGMAPWRVGVRGRLSMFGEEMTSLLDLGSAEPKAFAVTEPAKFSTSGKLKPAAIVTGYPAFDAPLLKFALRRQHARYEVLSYTWLETTDFEKYRVVVYTGDLPRAKITRQFSKADLARVRAFMEEGGILMIMPRAINLFYTEWGKEFLAKLAGTPSGEAELDYQLLLPEHPWVKHLDPSLVQSAVKVPGGLEVTPEGPGLLGEEAPAPPIVTKVIRIGYLDPRVSVPIWVSRGERIIGTRGGATNLYRLRVGRGQFIYLGWPISRYRPHGRMQSTHEKETIYEQQVQILLNIVTEIYPSD